MNSNAHGGVVGGGGGEKPRWKMNNKSGVATPRVQDSQAHFLDIGVDVDSCRSKLIKGIIYKDVHN